MRKWICLFSMLLFLGLAACSGRADDADAAVQEEAIQEEAQTAEENAEPENTEEESAETEATEGESVDEGMEENSILIAYFTWADNTVVTDEEAAIESALSHYDSIGDSSEYEGTDAVSSASVIAPGNTAQLAQWIGQETGGELFSIQVSEPYPSDYDACMDRASDELAEDARPELSTHVENMDQYDTVFLGYPNWWSDCPAAVLSFIEEYDFSGKTVVLFCSHGTGGVGRSVQTITAALPEDCTIVEDVLGVYRPDVPGAQSEVQDWLSRIGMAGTGGMTDNTAESAIENTDGESSGMEEETEMQ